MMQEAAAPSQPAPQPAKQGSFWPKADVQGGSKGDISTATLGQERREGYQGEGGSIRANWAPYIAEMSGEAICSHQSVNAQCVRRTV